MSQEQQDATDYVRVTLTIHEFSEDGECCTVSDKHGHGTELSTDAFLHDAEDSVNQKTLERHLMIKPSTVNGIVDRLEEKGLVYRTVSATDGRCRILALTEEGQRFHDDFQTVLHQVNERLERGFTQEEKAQFTAFLLRAGRNLTDEEEEA